MERKALTRNKLRFRASDGVILLLCIAAGVFIFYRVKYGLEYKADWSVIPQFLIKRHPETGRWVPNYLLQGLGTTLKLSLWATILACILGSRHRHFPHQHQPFSTHGRQNLC